MKPGIPFFCLKIQHQRLENSIQESLRAVFDSGKFILGTQLRRFENEVAEYLKVPHALGCASGTASLFLAMRALDIGPGDEVIVPDFGFIAPVEAVIYTGATPVLCDVFSHNFLIDPAAVGMALTERTRAIIAIHLFGQAADVSRLLEIAEKAGIKLIEDCAQAFGAEHLKRKVGSIGHLGCHSFFPTKNLGGCGDGGMVTTHDSRLAEKILLLRNHGCDGRHLHQMVGYNSRLDEIQAAILRIKLRHIESQNRLRIELADHYFELLGNVDSLRLPGGAPEVFHVFNQFTILSKKRDAIARALQEQGIGNCIYYPLALHEQPSLLKRIRVADPCLRAKKLSRSCLSLPIYPELERQDVERIAKVIQKAVAN